MEDLIIIRENINQMADLVLSMLRATFDGFMKHELDILTAVLKDEERLNAKERTITLSLIDISKGKGASEKKNTVLLSDIVAGLEEIGDYIKDMIERIEIKIQEKLLFSEEALNEYRHLYSFVETALADVVNALKLDDKDFAKRVSGDGGHADSMVEKYRQAHAQRLICGACDPRAGNMFVNLLDFTAQIYHHTEGLARNILELK